MTSKDVIAQLRGLDRQMDQTQVSERPGGITGFNTFYDQGTYVPTYVGAATAGVTTYTTQLGWWVRIGAVVIVTGTVIWTNATGTGQARISLPFAVPNVTDKNFSGSLRVSGVTFAAGTPQIFIVPNTQYFIMQSPTTNAAPTTVAVEVAGEVEFTITYFVA
jgi:hypothetical protein